MQFWPSFFSPNLRFFEVFRGFCPVFTHFMGAVSARHLAGWESYLSSVDHNFPEICLILQGQTNLIQLLPSHKLWPKILVVCACQLPVAVIFVFPNLAASQP